MLTSYRSLQSCMPLVHAGRAGEERRGGKKQWEETKKRRNGLFCFQIPTDFFCKDKYVINPGEIITVNGTG